MLHQYNLSLLHNIRPVPYLHTEYVVIEGIVFEENSTPRKVIGRVDILLALFDKIQFTNRQRKNQLSTMVEYEMKIL